MLNFSLLKLNLMYCTKIAKTISEIKMNVHILYKKKTETLKIEMESIKQKLI